MSSSNQANKQKPVYVKPQRVLLVGNPEAGQSSAWQDAINALETVGLDVVVADVDQPWVEQLSTASTALEPGHVDAIVLAGGDGTVNYHLDDVLASGLPLGVMPLGTANDFFRSLDQRVLDCHDAVDATAVADVAAAAEAIANGRVAQVDVGYVNDQPFLNTLHLGAGQQVAEQVSAIEKQALGSLAYVSAMLRVAANMRMFSVTVEWRKGKKSHKKRRKVLAAGICNSRYFGGGMNLVDAGLIDHQLWWFYIKPMRWYDSLKFTLEVLLKRYGWRAQPYRLPWLSRYAATELTLRTDQPMPVTLDGDESGNTPLTCRIEPGALPVFVRDNGDKVEAE